MDDLISRQAAIDAVGSMLRRKFGIGGDLAKITLSGLPSAQPERRWKETMPKPNEITFDLSNYDGGETEMFADIGRVLKILTNNGYICTFSCDEPAFQIYVIEFDYQDEELCNVKPYWITPEQMEKLQDLESEDTDDGTDAG